MKTIVLKTVTPTYGLDNKFTGFQSELDARYPFNANGLVMAIAKAKAIFAQGYARGLELAFSYSSSEDRAMPMPELFRLMDLPIYRLASDAEHIVDAELVSRQNERLTSIAMTAMEDILAAHPEYEIEVDGEDGTRDLTKLAEMVYVPTQTDSIEPLHVAVKRKGERINAFTLFNDGNGHDIFAAYSSDLEPVLKRSLDMIDAFDKAA